MPALVLAETVEIQLLALLLLMAVRAVELVQAERLALVVLAVAV